MAAKTHKYDRLQGGSRKPVQLLFDLDDHKRVRLAAAAAGKPMAQFAVEATLAATEKILKNLSH